jgi:hypothetical protein
MEKKTLMAISTSLAEEILEACEKSKTGEIAETKLRQLIFNFLNDYING